MFTARYGLSILNYARFNFASERKQSYAAEHDTDFSTGVRIGHNLTTRGPNGNPRIRSTSQ